MSGKYIKVKRVIIPTVTLVLIASQLMGCGATDKTGLLNILRDNGEAIEIEVAEPVNSTGDLELTEIDDTWLPLASLDNASSLREAWDDILLVSGTTGNKNGVLYVNSEGLQELNNTLQTALHNRAFIQIIEDKVESLKLAQAVDDYYVDTKELKDDYKVLMGISSYFNLIDDEQEHYATPEDTLTRLQFYSMLYKAITPVEEDTDNNETELKFTEAVNSYSELNYYASQIEDKAYINTSDQSLNEKTVNGKISRGEAIYLLMNTFYPTELVNIEVTGSEFSDCNLQTTTFDKQDGTDGDTYLDSYRAQVSYNNEDEYGCKDEIYKALVLAKQKGLINGDETRYDEAITKVEAIQFLVDTLENSGSGEKFNYKNGKTISSETTTESISIDIDSQIESINEYTSNKSIEDMTPIEESYGIDVPEEYMTTENDSVSDISSYTVTKLDKTMVANDNGRLREGPSSTSDVVRTIDQNDTIKVTGKVNEADWYQVNIDNQTLYISSSLLSEIEVKAENKETTTSKETTSQNTTSKETTTKQETTPNTTNETPQTQETTPQTQPATDNTPASTPSSSDTTTSSSSNVNSNGLAPGESMTHKDGSVEINANNWDLDNF
jgi:uncharacterized protein YgiM (DUF1202 family)